MNISLFLMLANYSSVLRGHKREVTSYRIQEKPRPIKRINECGEIGQEKPNAGFPWMAALYHSSELICGGSIVSPSIIVIAAHCLLEKDEVTPKYNARNSVFVVKETLKTHRILEIYKFVIHPEWNVETKEYDADIALGILQKSLKFNDKIYPVCLPYYSKSAKDLVGYKGLVGRWGSTKNYVYGDKPIIVELPVEVDKICMKYEEGLNSLMSNRTFCTGKNPGQGLCKGDSGNGLVQKQYRKYVLRGIVSSALSESCGGKAFVIFTDVAQFSKWILTYINLY